MKAFAIVCAQVCWFVSTMEKVMAFACSLFAKYQSVQGSSKCEGFDLWICPDSNLQQCERAYKAW